MKWHILSTTCTSMNRFILVFQTKTGLSQCQQLMYEKAYLNWAWLLITLVLVSIWVFKMQQSRKTELMAARLLNVRLYFGFQECLDIINIVRKGVLSKQNYSYCCNIIVFGFAGFSNCKKIITSLIRSLFCRTTVYEATQKLNSLCVDKRS